MQVGEIKGRLKSSWPRGPNICWTKLLGFCTSMASWLWASLDTEMLKGWVRGRTPPGSSNCSTFVFNTIPCKPPKKYLHKFGVLMGLRWNTAWSQKLQAKKCQPVQDHFVNTEMLAMNGCFQKIWGKHGNNIAQGSSSSKQVLVAMQCVRAFLGSSGPSTIKIPARNFKNYGKGPFDDLPIENCHFPVS